MTASPPDSASAAKAAVLDHLCRLDEASPGAETTSEMMRSHAPDHLYLGVHPFNTLSGPQDVAELVWTPFKSAVGMVQRRLDIVIAGHHNLDPNNPIWVACMGHVLGLFDSPWLDIPSTGKVAHLPFASAYRVQGDKIVETIEFLDVLSVMNQAGVNPHADIQTAAQIMSPGPQTHDGVLSGPQPAEEGERTHRLTKAMLDDLVDSGMRSSTAHLERFWNPDMNWFGPTGIGACMGIKSYQRGHTRPFQDRLKFIEAIDEKCVVAEGHFAAHFWYPCLKMASNGGFLGLPPSDVPAEMRVVDLYRRDGDMLAENWIFIDMLHFLKMHGDDALGSISK